MRRLASDDEELEAAELQKKALEEGATPIAECAPRDRSTVLGTIQSTTLRPRAGVPTLEAELYDGTGTLYVVWLGRRQMAGIKTGVKLLVEGRIGVQGNRRTMYNPRYTLLPAN